jgi:hypothetical protein
MRTPPLTSPSRTAARVSGGVCARTLPSRFAKYLADPRLVDDGHQPRRCLGPDQ